jgi:hypothetical protein
LLQPPTQAFLVNTVNAFLNAQVDIDSLHASSPR